MFQVYLYNFGYYLQEDYPTREAAEAAGIASGFQFIIEEA
jgi:hypothetical protein